MIPAEWGPAHAGRSILAWQLSIQGTPPVEGIQANDFSGFYLISGILPEAKYLKSGKIPVIYNFLFPSYKYNFRWFWSWLSWLPCLLVYHTCTCFDRFVIAYMAHTWYMIDFSVCMNRAWSVSVFPCRLNVLCWFSFLIEADKMVAISQVTFFVEWKVLYLY